MSGCMSIVHIYYKINPRTMDTWGNIIDLYWFGHLLIHLFDLICHLTNICWFVQWFRQHTLKGIWLHLLKTGAMNHRRNWKPSLVGGWTTHLKNMLVKLHHFPKVRDENKTYVWNILKPPPSSFKCLHFTRISIEIPTRKLWREKLHDRNDRTCDPRSMRKNPRPFGNTYTYLEDHPS